MTSEKSSKFEGNVVPLKKEAQAAEKPSKRGVRHKPNAHSRRRVRLMLESGLTREAAAEIEGISETTLRKHYAEELAACEPQPPGIDPHAPSEEQRKRVETMLMCGSTIEQVALVEGISETTLRKHYPEELARGYEKGNAQLRQSQMKKGLAGDTAMLIWLGKQRLGQSDKIDNRHGVDASLGGLLARIAESGRKITDVSGAGDGGSVPRPALAAVQPLHDQG